MKRSERGYDVRCEDLARVFLSDPDFTDAEKTEHAPKLAQHIQDAIENYLNYDLKEMRAPGESGGAG